jgi:8-oxo-dGTP pyrophosphatase MutT (NUDIX family)
MGEPVSHGAKLLPYFFTADGECHVVLVEQFRRALNGELLEAAGGKTDSENIFLEMCRELREETGIEVFPDDVEFIFEAYIQPSLMASKAYGGIVAILEREVPTELHAGEIHLGERTRVSVRSLKELLDARARGEIVFDLETWILLDAVAKLAP